MKKKTRNLLVLAVVFVLLVAGYYAIDLLPEKEEETEPVPVTETMEVTEFSSEDVVSYRYVNADHEMELLVTETGYVNTADEEFLVNSEKANGQLSVLGNLTALQVVESTDKTEFGLDNPQITIAVTLQDGTVRNFHIGDRALFEAADYLLDADKDVIYLVEENLYSAFDCLLDDMRQPEETEEVTEEVTEETTE